MQNLIFVKYKIDIEHIQATNDKDDRNKIKKEWGDILNSIGNLIVLEYSINRSIGNNNFNNKIVNYKDSKFSIVKNLSTTYLTWGLEDAENRKEIEIKKISEFMYDSIT